MYMWDTTHLYLRHTSLLFQCETWLMYTWDITHVYVRHDSYTCDTRLMYTWVMLARHLATRALRKSNVRHDSCISETWLIYMWDMTHAYVRHDSCICETWLMYMWDMLAHDSGTRAIRKKPTCYSLQKANSLFIYKRRTRFANWIWDMTHVFVRHDSFKCETFSSLSINKQRILSDIHYKATAIHEMNSRKAC